ncbi:hypothetical protein ALP35_04475, partial [Pseudomonas savastanoi pv. glycinea]
RQWPKSCPAAAGWTVPWHWPSCWIPTRNMTIRKTIRLGGSGQKFITCLFTCHAKESYCSGR